MKDPAPSPSKVEAVVHTTKTEVLKKLNEHFDRLRDEIREMQTKSLSLKETALAKWHTTIADIEAKQKVAREKLASVTTFTDEALEHLRDAANNAWNELEQAVRKAGESFHASATTLDPPAMDAMPSRIRERLVDGRSNRTAR